MPDSVNIRLREIRKKLKIDSLYSDSQLITQSLGIEKSTWIERILRFGNKVCFAS